jgi:ligand-binding sensor domain-containing protein
MSDNVILTIYEDRDGVLWVGIDAGGVNRYDPITDRFVVYTHDPANPYSLSNDIIFALAPAADGTLWLSTNHGLSRFDPHTETFRDNGRGIAADDLEQLGQKFRRLKQGQHDPDGMGLGLNFCIGILQLSGGDLWITSAGEAQGATVTMTLPRNAV